MTFPCLEIPQLIDDYFNRHVILPYDLSIGEIRAGMLEVYEVLHRYPSKIALRRDLFRFCWLNYRRRIGVLVDGAGHQGVPQQPLLQKPECTNSGQILSTRNQKQSLTLGTIPLMLSMVINPTHPVHQN